MYGVVCRCGVRLSGPDFGESALCVEVIDDGFNLIGLEDIAKGGHASTAVVDLVLDLRFIPALADGAEIGAQIPTVAVDAVAVFAASFVKEGRSDGFAFSRIGTNDGARRVRHIEEQPCKEKRGRDNGDARDSGTAQTANEREPGSGIDWSGECHSS